MQWLQAFLSSVFSKITTAVLDHIRQLGNKMVLAIGTVTTLLLAPVNSLMKWITSIVQWCTTEVQMVTGIIGNLHFTDFGQYWNAFAPYFGLLDLFIPLTLLTFTISTVLGLWAITTLVRLIKGLIPGEN